MNDSVSVSFIFSIMSGSRWFYIGQGKSINGYLFNKNGVVGIL